MTLLNLYYIVIVEIIYKIRTSFKALCTKERNNMAFTKTSEQRNIFMKNNDLQLSYGVKKFHWRKLYR